MADREAETGRGGKSGRKELADRHGIGIETLRYYESIGLLEKPERDRNNYRRYSADYGKLLDFIIEAKRRGFSLSEIKGFIALLRSSGAGRERMMEAIDAKLADLGARIAELRARAAWLEALKANPRLGECDTILALKKKA